MLHKTSQNKHMCMIRTITSEVFVLFCALYLNSVLLNGLNLENFPHQDGNVICVCLFPELGT